LRRIKEFDCTLDFLAEGGGKGRDEMDPESPWVVVFPIKRYPGNGWPRFRKQGNKTGQECGFAESSRRGQQGEAPGVT